MIRSVLEYGGAVYGDLPDEYEMGRIICGAIINTSYSRIRNELGWSTVSLRRYFLGRPKFVTSNIGTTKYIDAHLRLTNIDHKPVFT
jgi:hypothetical protein